MIQPSAAANVIPFPKRNKGRVRKTESFGAWGTGAFSFFGIEPPANVVVLDDVRQIETDRSEMMDLLAICLWATASDEQQADIKTQIDCAAKNARSSERRAVARSLSGLLRRK